MGWNPELKKNLWFKENARIVIQQKKDVAEICKDCLSDTAHVIDKGETE